PRSRKRSTCYSTRPIARTKSESSGWRVNDDEDNDHNHSPRSRGFPASEGGVRWGEAPTGGDQMTAQETALPTKPHVGQGPSPDWTRRHLLDVDDLTRDEI